MDTYAFMNSKHAVFAFLSLMPRICFGVLRSQHSAPFPIELGDFLHKFEEKRIPKLCCFFF